MLDELLFIALRGIGLGAIYTLVALSFNVVHSSSGILNFAQGNVLVLGGLTAFLLSSSESLAGSVPAWLGSLPLAALAVAVMLSVQGWVTLLPLRYSTEQDSWIISTMAVSTIIGAVMLIVQGPWAQSARSPFPSFELFGASTPAPYVLCVLASVAWYVLLRWFLSRTLTGLAISALSQDLEAARAAGLPVRRLQLLAFAISGLVVGSAGFVAAPIISIGADSGFRYVLNGFLVCIIGGLGSNAGSLIAGPIVGVVGMLATYQFGGQFQTLASLAMLLLILTLKPEGLFGRAAARRV
jgi:branched-chain amino acid transport system permease protein